MNTNNAKNFVLMSETAKAFRACQPLLKVRIKQKNRTRECAQLDDHGTIVSMMSWGY